MNETHLKFLKNGKKGALEGGGIRKGNRGCEYDQSILYVCVER
jgi:hypothetical protein